jgi:hypothetical protein
VKALARSGFRVLRAGKEQWQLHVFKRGEGGQQLEKLKNEANFVAAKLG